MTAAAHALLPWGATTIALPERPRPRALRTLSHLAEIAWAGHVDPLIVMVAREVVAGSSDDREAIGRLLEFVRGRVSYVKDPVGADTFAPVRHVLLTRRGDCDESAPALAALMLAVGIPARLLAARPRANDPEWRHVWAEGFDGRAWVAADATVREPLGWRVSPAHGLIGVGMGGIFDSIKDAVGGLFEAQWDFVSSVADKAYKLARRQLRSVWKRLPKEVRELAMVLGPMVADAYFPGSGRLAEVALGALEGDRKARSALKRFREAQARGEAIPVTGGGTIVLPKDLDLEDPNVLLSVARAGDPEVRAAWAAREGGASFARDGAVVVGSLLAVAVLA